MTRLDLPLLLFGFHLFGQPGPTLVFTRLLPPGTAPTPRADGAIAYDSERRQVILFGGVDQSGDRDDTWAYSPDSRQWTEIQPRGSRPGARHGHSLIYDPVRQRVVAFAGQGRSFFGDVWAYDIRGNAWTQFSAGGGPSARYAHGAIYDGRRDRMVVSHGFTSESGRFDDTWAFEFSTNTWRNLTPSDNRPLRRCLMHTVWDERNDQMLLFGGCASGFGPCPLNDLWSLDLARNRWTERTSNPRPSPRERFGAAFDSTRQRLVLFSGGGATDDTWEYDPASDRWSSLTPGGERPAARSRHEAAFAADLAAVFFFGGQTANYTNELLMLAPPGAASPRPQIVSGGARNAFSGGNLAAAAGEIKAVFGTGLGPQEGVASAFDGNGFLPATLAGVSATVNGIAAPLYFVRADQVNLQMPYESGTAGEARIVVSYSGQASAEERVPLVAANPGIHAKIFNQDFSLNAPENPAASGNILILFVTGQGATIPPSVTGKRATEPYPVPAGDLALRIGGKTAEIRFMGQAPGTAGVMQINAMVPDGISGDAAVELAIGGRVAQSGVRVFVR